MADDIILDSLYKVKRPLDSPPHRVVVILGVKTLLAIPSPAPKSNSPPIGEREQVHEGLGDDELVTRLVTRLKELLGDVEEYDMVVLANSDKGKGMRDMPGAMWWVNGRGLIPKELRKGIQRLFIVHPTKWISTFLPIILPLFSPKTAAKVKLVPSLSALVLEHDMSLQGLRLPIHAIEEESRVAQSAKQSDNLAPSQSWYDTLSSVASYASFSYWSTPNTTASAPVAETGLGYWNRTADDIVKMSQDAGGDQLRLMDELRRVILAHCSGTEGIFRLAPSNTLRPGLISLLGLPVAHQPKLDWDAIAMQEPHLPPKLYLRLFSSSAEPLIPPSAYSMIRSIHDPSQLKDFFSTLDASSSVLLDHLITTLQALLPHQSATRMSALNLAIVVAPDLIRGPDPREDMTLCLPPTAGKAALQVLDPDGDGQGTSLVGVLVMLLEKWRENDGAEAGA